MEEQVFCFNGDVAEFVDDEQVVSAQAFEYGLESSGVVCLGECVDPSCGGVEKYSVTLLSSGDAQGGGEVCFSGAWRAEKDDVFSGCDPGAGF